VNPASASSLDDANAYAPTPAGAVLLRAASSTRTGASETSPASPTLDTQQQNSSSSAPEEVRSRISALPLTTARNTCIARRRVAACYPVCVRHLIFVLCL
jgi:hypothetical protein